MFSNCPCITKRPRKAYSDNLFLLRRANKKIDKYDFRKITKLMWYSPAWLFSKKNVRGMLRFAFHKTDTRIIFPVSHRFFYLSLCFTWKKVDDIWMQRSCQFIKKISQKTKCSLKNVNSILSRGDQKVLQLRPLFPNKNRIKQKNSYIPSKPPML